MRFLPESGVFIGNGKTQEEMRNSQMLEQRYLRWLRRPPVCEVLFIEMPTVAAADVLVE